MTDQEIQAVIADREFVRDVMSYCDAVATEEDRALTDDEQKGWTEGERFIAQADARLARHNALVRSELRPGAIEAGDAPGIQARVSAFEGGDDVAYLRPAEARDKALKALEDRSRTSHLEDSQLEQVEALIRTRTGNTDGSQIAKRLLLTENEHYRTAFQKLTTQPQAILSAEESRAVQAWDEFRAMSEGTTTAGGFGVPVFIDPTIVLTAQGHPNDFFAISDVKTITTNVWKGVNSAGVSWSFDGEAAEVSDDSPTLAQPVVQAYMARGFIPFSIEVSQDYVGFASEMNGLLTEGYSELCVSKFTNGSGSGEPRGIVTALDANTNDELAVTTDGAFGAIDVYAAWAQLPIRWRANARWMSSVDAQNEVRQFGTADNHAFTINLTQEEIPRLFGKQYHTNDYMPTFTGTTGARNILIVGDFKQFVIAQRTGMSVELVPHLFHTDNNRPSGQRGWFAHARVGSNTRVDTAFVLLQNT